MTENRHAALSVERPAHEDEFEAALRWAINHHLAAYLKLVDEAKCYPSNAIPTELADDLHDAEETLAEVFRLVELPESMDSIREAFFSGTPEAIHALHEALNSWRLDDGQH
jgi:hypothetical protein